MTRVNSSSRSMVTRVTSIMARYAQPLPPVIGVAVVVADKLEAGAIGSAPPRSRPD